MSNGHALSKEFFPGTATEYLQEGHELTFTCDNRASLKVYIISEEIFRFRYSPDGLYANDFSYAIAENYQPNKPDFQIQQSYNFYDIVTTKFRCRIYKEGLRVQVIDKQGNTIMEDAERGFHWEDNKMYGGHVVQMSKAIQDRESFFGLGDKSTRLNLRGKRLQNWSTDAFGFGPHTDPLYKNVPFYYAEHQKGCYGIFFDNTFRSFFDFGHENPQICSFWASGGEMNYYFIHGDTMLDIGETYTLLTGTPELPPLWSLGYHQCKWSYYPESEVKELAAKFREEQIPCDCIYLDIDYMDGYRCFTWDKTKFPDPKRMIAELAEDGFKTIVMIDPGIMIDPDYSIYKEGLEGDYFVKRQDGDLLKGEVWPGPCHFPDYTNPKVREWWADLYKDLIRRDGVAGFWNDMNEPAVFDRDEKTIYLDARHDYDGNPCSHRKAHNIYGMQMARASYDGIKAHVYPKRPFLITRAIYSGTQRYALFWTGDNQATWEHLKIANVQCQRMSVSGCSFVGTDIGGFDGIPSGELFTRWVQLGIFHPFFRVHSMGDNLSGNAAIDHEAVEANKRNGKITDQEPWSFGEPYTDAIRKAIELRYQLLPYIYSTFWQYTTYGTPMIRSLAFLADKDPETYYREEEFSLGENLLVCPVTEPNTTSRLMYLPDGQWINYWTDEVVDGKQEIEVSFSLEQLPIHVKAGSVIPMAPVMQYVGEKPIDILTLHVYYTKDTHTSILYEDAGEGYGYTEGNKSLKEFTVTATSEGLSITQSIEGAFETSYQTYRIVMHALPDTPTAITIDGEELEEANDLTFIAQANFGEILLTIPPQKPAPTTKKKPKADDSAA